MILELVEEEDEFVCDCLQRRTGSSGVQGVVQVIFKVNFVKCNIIPVLGPWEYEPERILVWRRMNE